MHVESDELESQLSIPASRSLITGEKNSVQRKTNENKSTQAEHYKSSNTSTGEINFQQPTSEIKLPNSTTYNNAYSDLQNKNGVYVPPNTIRNNATAIRNLENFMIRDKICPASLTSTDAFLFFFWEPKREIPDENVFKFRNVLRDFSVR